MITGNKGEWSEVYAFLKLLADGVLYSGDSELNKNPDLFYPIIKVLRKDISSDIDYLINKDLVIISSDGREKIRIPIASFIEHSKYLFKMINESKGSSFSLAEIEFFMNEIACTRLKASSSDKSDIRIIIHDFRTGLMPTLGFSIKSRLGSPSTLFNSAKSTNFIYKITPNNNFKNTTIKEINSISNIKERVKEIIKLGNRITYYDLEGKICKNNFILIDSLLPEIIANMLLHYYSSDKSKLDHILNILNIENPLNFDCTNNHSFYEYKVKRLLTDAALGMTSSRVWSGKYDATGGYIIVKEDGDLLCYHIYNKNEFEDYLLKNTKFETPSTSKYDFGSLYENNDNLLIKLNLQIRFIK